MLQPLNSPVQTFVVPSLTLIVKETSIKPQSTAAVEDLSLSLFSINIKNVTLAVNYSKY